MTRPAILAAGLLTITAATALAGAVSVALGQAEEQTVTAIPIKTFMTAGVGQPVQGLIWRGGIEMRSPTDTFGGTSGIGFTGLDGQLVMVTDRGNFVSGQLIYDDAHEPVSLVGVRVEPIQNSQGEDLPRQFARDAEALSVIERDGRPAAVRVGFENLTRVADFELTDFVPSGPAREIPIPNWLSEARTNESLEAICVAPPASPIAGSTLLLTEAIYDAAGNHAGYLLGESDRGEISYAPSGTSNPSDCTFLPNGDLLVLERGVAFLTFNMKLKRIRAADVRPGAVMQGELLLQSSGADIDNMEGIATHTGPDGITRITIISDNNFNDWERSLLLEFSLPG
jgi:hypothetical protein